MIPPFTLGTVQLGMAYGTVVANALPDEETVNAVFDLAWNAGLTCFDTHRAYGIAEDRIGAWMAKGGHVPQLVSKLPLLQGATGDDAEALVLRHLGTTRATLGRVPELYLVPLPELSKPEVLKTVRAQVEAGALGGFGSSVYAPDEAMAAMDIPGLKALQIPANLLDRRFATAGALARAQELGVAVFARSVYLQGALLMQPDALPPHMQPAATPLKALRDLAAEAGIPFEALAIAGVGREPGITSVILAGVTPAQLRQSLDWAAVPVPAEILAAARALVPELPAEVIDPRIWPQP